MRRFVEDQVDPREVEAGMNDGFIRQETCDAIFAATKDIGLYFPSIPEEGSGTDLSKLEITVIQEAVGRTTNGMWVATPISRRSSMHMANEHRMQRYVRPMLNEAMRVGYAITEFCAGSDVDVIEATAVKDGNGYVLNGSDGLIR
ncbi:MAG: acyl-CoA/acyl-ACP dehydrogenase [Rhodospirillales bacterium]|nr:acyl-CoA/acyl-ACP dehydrogenase [Rhodospirillales bacterium]